MTEGEARAAFAAYGMDADLADAYAEIAVDRAEAFGLPLVDQVDDLIMAIQDARHLTSTSFSSFLPICHEVLKEKRSLKP